MCQAQFSAPRGAGGGKDAPRGAAAKPTGDATIELAMTLAEVMAAADPPRLAGRRVALTEAYRNKVLSASGRRADSDVRKVHACIVLAAAMSTPPSSAGGGADRTTEEKIADALLDKGEAARLDTGLPPPAFSSYREFTGALDRAQSLAHEAAEEAKRDGASNELGWLHLRVVQQRTDMLALVPDAAHFEALVKRAREELADISAGKDVMGLAKLARSLQPREGARVEDDPAFKQFRGDCMARISALERRSRRADAEADAGQE